MFDLIALIGRVVLFTTLLYILAHWFHEGAHWMIARTQTTAISFHLRYRIVPNSVYYHEPEAFSRRGLRLTAVAPQLLLLPFVLGYVVVSGIPDAQLWMIDGMIRPFIESCVVFAALAGGVVISPADLLAACCPEEYEHWEECVYGEYTHMELAKVVVACFRSG